jgi:Protein of unknown function (DUF1573)
MKKYLFLIHLSIICTVFMSCSSSKSIPVTPPEVVTPKLVFTPLVVEYGTIEQGSDPLRKVNVTNTGSIPISIIHALGSCGCLVPSYDKTPIQPGASSIFEIRYDTQRIGPFLKKITIETNEKGNLKYEITVQGTVKDKPSDANVPTHKN